GIFIISQKAVKFHSRYSFQHFFLAYRSKLFCEHWNIGLIISVTNICLEQLIHEVKKLFTANILSTGDFQFMKRSLNHSFNLLQLSYLPAMHNRKAKPGISGPARSATPVCIYFYVIRQFVIDHMSYSLHINTSCRNIGGDKQLQGFLPEF